MLLACIRTNTVALKVSNVIRGGRRCVVTQQLSPFRNAQTHPGNKECAVSRWEPRSGRQALQTDRSPVAVDFNSSMYLRSSRRHWTPGCRIELRSRQILRARQGCGVDMLHDSSSERAPGHGLPDVASTYQLRLDDPIIDECSFYIPASPGMNLGTKLYLLEHHTYIRTVYAIT
jgi:hypothetical protein